MESATPETPTSQASGSAIYFDGVSSRRRTVTLRWSERLEIAEDGQVLAAWAYADIRRVDGPAGVLRLSCLTAPALARLEIRDSAFAAELTARLRSGEPGYLRKRILPEHANRIHALGEPALEFPRENERFYPQGSMAAHVLGFVSADGHGRVGMEEVFDDRLTDPVSRARPAVLSIDARVQGALEDELMRGIADSNAKGAAGVILDADTGEVVIGKNADTVVPIASITKLMTAMVILDRGLDLEEPIKLSREDAVAM